MQLASLSCVRSVIELVQAERCPQPIQHNQVALQVEVVILVGRVRLDIPRLRRALARGKGAVARLVALGLIVHRVEARDAGEELGNLRVCCRVQCGREDRLENVLEHLLEVVELPRRAVDVVESWHLNHPTVGVGHQIVVKHPPREFLPFAAAPAIDAQTPLGVLILGFLEVVEKLAGELRQISALHVVVRLQENSPQVRLVQRIVFLIEAVETVEDCLVGRHVQLV
mmetsp:Transcript_110443/g.235937  ORF Transcript_110443/g.235937 Transcript_110443/m.235937 type:complete len:227 (+) Transcript_110443:1021-1701(+)